MAGLLEKVTGLLCCAFGWSLSITRCLILILKNVTEVTAFEVYNDMCLFLPVPASWHALISSCQVEGFSLRPLSRRFASRMRNFALTSMAQLNVTITNNAGGNRASHRDVARGL